jgi:zinc D-Ala-D-Ala dipeptidase
MFTHGFKTIDEEWWHFTLKNEPYPADKESSYFNFPVE